MMDASSRLKETLFKVESVFFLIYSQLYAECAKAKTEEVRISKLKAVDAITGFHKEIMKYAVNASMLIIGEAETNRREGKNTDVSVPLPHPFEEVEGKSEAEILDWLKEKAQASLAEAAIEKARERREAE